MMDRRGFLKNATLVSAACLMDFMGGFGNWALRMLK